MPRVSHNVGMPAGPLWRTIIEGGAHHSPPGNQTCWYMLNFSIKSKQFCEENKNWMRLKLWTAKYARSEWLFEELDQWRNVNEGENVKRHTLPYWWEHVHRDVDQMPLRVKAALKVKVQEDGGLEEDSLEERKGEKVAGMHRQRRDEAHPQRVGGLLNSIWLVSV